MAVAMTTPTPPFSADSTARTIPPTAASVRPTVWTTRSAVCSAGDW